MSISAINCVPIKPQVNFGRDNEKELDYNNVVCVADKLNDNFVHSSTIKKPLAIASSLALATLIAYVGGSKVATGISKIIPSAPNKVVGGIDKLIKKSADTAKILKESPTGKMGTVKKFAGKTLGLVSKVSAKGYDKLGGNIADTAKKNAKVFENIIGLGATASILPGLLSKDANEDGVSDILQKGQNAYTGAKTSVNESLGNLTLFGELIDLLT